MYRRKDVVDLILEGGVSQDNSVAVHGESALLKGIVKMGRVVRILLDEIVLAVKVQAFGAAPVQSNLGIRSFFKHYERRPRQRVLAVEEQASTGETINEIEPEYFLARIHV